MIDVYICEDNIEQRKSFVHYVQAAIMIEEYDMCLRLETDNPNRIIEEVKVSKNTGLYFLDIDLHSEVNGLILAEKIRQHDPRGFIVFITVHSEMTLMTFQYKVEALDFVVKDDFTQIRNRICECMANAIEKYKNVTRGGGRTFTVNRGGYQQILKYDDVLYFETSLGEHKIIVHTENKSVEFLGTIKKMEEDAGEDFIRCHQSYLVNRNKIKEINYRERIITLKNGINCPISQKLARKVRRLLI